MKLMEHWGSGIPRIIECVVEAGLKESEFIDGDVDLRINIYRGQIGDTSGDVTNNVTNNVTNKSPEESIITMIEADPMEAGTVSREGTTRSGKWVINRK